ncbi:hypothetical protein [Streptococcus pluranimalium]|uniref:hypothetical protein n=1 Tax=Streptococcus pluranimalium TaxID=82348 RepID=UPI003BF92283
MGYTEIMDMITSGATGGAEGARALKKKLDRYYIKTYCAPPIKTDRKQIEKTYDELIDVAAASAGTAVQTIGAQMDSGIKGKSGKAVLNVVNDNRSKFSDF